ADQWLARGRTGTQAVLHVLPGHFYREFFIVRVCAEPGISSSLPGVARSGRRRVAADGSGHSRRHISAATARFGVCAVWDHSDHGAHDWANPRALDYLQLFMAVDFFYQSSGWPGDMVPGAALCGRPS